MHTISDFWKLNKHILRKPYPIPKIGTTIQELEYFTYETSLDQNMGNYTIRLVLSISLARGLEKGSTASYAENGKQT